MNTQTLHVLTSPSVRRSTPHWQRDGGGEAAEALLRQRRRRRRCRRRRRTRRRRLCDGGLGGGGCVGSCRSSCRTCREGLEPLGPRLHHGHEPATTSCVDGVPTRVCVLRSSEPQCICERGRHSVGGRMSAAGASEWPSARHGRRRTVRCALSVDEVRARAPRITSPHRQLRHSSWRGRRRARIARRRSTPGCRWAPWAWWSR